MSERLQKLVDYLNNQNYEMAIATYSDNYDQLSQIQQIQLAKAFFVNENYKKSSQMIDNLINSQKPQIKYQSCMLKAKSLYLLGEFQQSMNRFERLYNEIKSSPDTYFPHTINRVDQIIRVLQKQNFVNKTMAINKQQLKKIGQNFKQTLQQSQNQGLMIGMPMFVVSEKWFHKFKRYLDGGEYPGMISQFQIVDDKYNLLYDPTPQKNYTNHLLFTTSRTKALPKKCWIILKQIFEGIQIKRFNISVLGKPNQVITELYLKKIKVRKQSEDKQNIVQISKKQNWLSVNNKLKNIWKYQGTLFEKISEKQVFVQEKAILQETDTEGKIYYYTTSIPQITKTNSNNIEFKCNFCKKTENLKYCQCKTVKYCNMNCLKEDRTNHKKRCELQLSHIKQKAAVLDNFELSEKKYAGKKGLVGLRNLGNTCYMNSGLQCLSNTRELTQYFMSNNFLNDINNSNPLGTKGNLACAYAELIRQIWTGNDSYVSPFKLKKIIGKFSPQFSGFGQQDSQQLISYLVDGLQEDLNLVKNKQTFEVKDEILPDQEASLISEHNYAKRIKAFVRSLMAGQFKSTVVCSLCNRKSICFDPYMLISLPVPSLKQNAAYFIPADSNMKTLKFQIQYDNETTVGQIKKYMNTIFKIDVKRGSYILPLFIDLDSKQIIQTSINDSDKFIDKVASLGLDNQMFFYQILACQKQEKLFQVDVFYSNKKINIPKFCNICPEISKKSLADELVKVFSRFYDGKNPMNAYESLPEINGSKISIHLKKELEMLKCKTIHEKVPGAKEKRLNLDYCLKNFALTQVLEKNNEWYCNKCKKFVKATKQMEIYKTSKILVLAFKRFSRGWKVQNSIQFPVQGLDMSPYIISHKSNKPIYYDLYGVVNHYGSLHGGHYTAYCKNFINNRWYQFDDSRVSEVRSSGVVSDSAYVLFYQLREK